MSEALTWDSELLDVIGCITCEDLSPLRSYMTRGTNLTMPGAVGTRPYAPVLDELDVTLVWILSGRFAPNGTPHSNHEQGVEQNVEHYRSLFTTPGAAITGEHVISLAYAGSTYGGTAQLRDLAVVRLGPGNARIVTRLVVTDGELVTTGS